MSDMEQAPSAPSPKEIEQEIAEANRLYPTPESSDSKAVHRALDQQLEGGRGSRAGYLYVAEPAPGHDTVGIWHTFPATTRSGYSSHACALHAMFEQLRIPAMLAPHPTMEIDTTKFPPDREATLMRWTKDAVGIPKLFVGSFPPDQRSLDIGIGVPAYVPYVAFEALPMSEYARVVCSSDLFKRIWCVSEFTKRCYESSGVDPNKLDVVRPAICDGIWAFMRAPRAFPPNDLFTFGVNGTWHERKGFHHLVRAYFSAFTKSDPVKLVIRTSYFGSGRDRPLMMDFERQVLGEIGKIKQEFQKSGWEMPRFQLLTGTSLTDRELVDWIGSLNCYVNPSFGEGLCIPLIHAAAQGVPVVTSDFGAAADVTRDCAGGTDEAAAFRVFKSRLAKVPREMLKHSALLSPSSQWGDYDIADLAAQMRAAFGAGQIRTSDTATKVLDRFSFKQCLPTLTAALSKVVDADTLAGWANPQVQK